VLDEKYIRDHGDRRFYKNNCYISHRDLRYYHRMQLERRRHHLEGRCVYHPTASCGRNGCPEANDHGRRQVTKRGGGFQEIEDKFSRINTQLEL
jgi:hypothetical protein